MRLLFASVEDYQDINAWSGTTSSMHAALARTNIEMDVVSPLKQKYEFPLKAAQTLRNTFGKKKYNRSREKVVVNGYARAIESAARRFRPDVIFSPSSVPMANVRSPATKVFWTDATFAGMVGYYPEFLHNSRRHLALGHMMERAALHNCSLAVYSSDWAKQSAQMNYAAHEAQLAVIPFGANMSDPGPVTRKVRNCRLLLVGKDWIRKGADPAIATVRRLRAGGVDATIDIVGCQPPEDSTIESFVTCHGRLDKSDPEQARRLDGLYKSASFFILPTQAECTPIVLAEAQAYGLPIIASDTGGMRSMITPNSSGYLFAHNTFAQEASRVVEEIWASAARYEAATLAARHTYVSRLNWDSATAELLRQIDSVRTRK